MIFAYGLIRFSHGGEHDHTYGQRGEHDRAYDRGHDEPWRGHGRAYDHPCEKHCIMRHARIMKDNGIFP